MHARFGFGLIIFTFSYYALAMSLLKLWICFLSSASTPAECSGHFRGFQKRDPVSDVLRGVNFPDPSIIVDNGRSYVFGTNDANGMLFHLRKILISTILMAGRNLKMRLPK